MSKGLGNNTFLRISEWRCCADRHTDSEGLLRTQCICSGTAPKTSHLKPFILYKTLGGQLLSALPPPSGTTTPPSGKFSSPAPQGGSCKCAYFTGPVDWLGAGHLTKDESIRNLPCNFWKQSPFSLWVGQRCKLELVMGFGFGHVKGFISRGRDETSKQRGRK